MKESVRVVSPDYDLLPLTGQYRVEITLYKHWVDVERSSLMERLDLRSLSFEEKIDSTL